MNTLPHTDLEAPAWAAPTAESAEDLDEPPEIRLQQPSPQRFQRTAIRQPSGQSSLLTKAIMGPSDDDDNHEHMSSTRADNQRRRSMTSNASVASTADLTSDTGLTSPCRTNTPSPPIPEMISMHLDAEISDTKKRCIQFACAAKPIQHDQPAARPGAASRTTSAQEPPRRPCIRFACPSAPTPTSDTFAGPPHAPVPKPPSANTSSQPMSLRRPSSKITLTRPKFLRANSKDLSKDSSQFHEFASGTAREEEWIRQEVPVITTKLTINDTLTKENRIRRLGAEAEEEALEEEEAEAATDDEELDELDGGDDDDQDEDDDGEKAEEDDSDGYYTDEETGFADSDEEEDDDENMRLWMPSHAINLRQNLTMVPARRTYLHEPQSDSSVATNGSIRRVKMKRAKPSSDTPDLPDSTDFVCGTLDEDRPLEEAYLSCLAARRNGKLRIIPQDIDPSFPASDPDDDDEEDIYNPVAHDSDTDVMVHGEMEDLHHGQDRSRRRRKSEHASPRKYRSPAPKRHHSPPPKTLGSPRQGAHVQFQLAGRPNTTHTKSLPRPAALFPYLKKERNMKYHHGSDLHVRGAIDIFKGLERKRQRRKEKFYQKYCNRARRGQIPERKPQPGRGAERMKELGLLMAGKKEQGNYVLSI
ncbi:GTP-binding protein SAR1 [Hirsutella rhossiliensis]|uniref:GTP-binding protein SAR1 n=1 Tax=Hirsutella rhossiliensis TaxID=111463 RepID=A0A9P8N2Y6_9HYPO|nr:GTP-binding protein SAR1 [Hirsutella rhossiliensis]KAH0965957.1 GTP-binding protein SAR1 [Hirsutella rhossiliensis]